MLMSFPPLTYMLKFSGFADLTSCQYRAKEHISRCAATTTAQGQADTAANDACHLLSLSCLSRNASCTRCIKAVSNALTATNANCRNNFAVCVTNKHWSRHAFRDIPKGQSTFNNLLFHGILQFKMIITLRCILHRCLSRDIHR